MEAAGGGEAALSEDGLCFPGSVVPRARWGAAPPKGRVALEGPARRAVIHHTALPACSGLSECARLLRSIQRAHVDERGFDDVGYK